MSSAVMINNYMGIFDLNIQFLLLTTTNKKEKFVKQIRRFKNRENMR